MTDANGTLISSIRYFSFGETRSGSVPTEKKFTGQTLDGTGLYYYGARYYDPTIGRFISADTLVSSHANPQSLNRYSYVLNNPLKYVDRSGHLPGTVDVGGQTYQVVDEGNGNYYLDAPDGTRTGSSNLARLMEMTAGYMKEIGDYGKGGNARTGSVVTVNWSITTGTTLPVDYQRGEGNSWGVGHVSSGSSAGLLATLLSGYKVESDISGALIVSIPERSLAAMIMGMLPTGDPRGAAGIAVNPFILVRPGIMLPNTIPGAISHERVHIYQQRAMGPAFWPAYGVASIFGWDANPFEVMARWISRFP